MRIKAEGAPPPSSSPSPLRLAPALTLRLALAPTLSLMVQPDATLLGELAEAVGKRKLTIPIAERLPLAKAGEAQERAEHGHVMGKILLLP